MADYSAITLEYNTGSEGTPSWSGTAMASGGSGDGKNEMRFANSGLSGLATTGSASWPLYPKPASVTVIPQAWIFTTADASGGTQVATYPTTPGTNNNGRVFRLSFPTGGTPVTPMQLTCYADVNHAQAVPGQQTTATGPGGPIVNGQVADTNNTAYIKGQVFGNGLDSSNNQLTPGSGSLTTAISASDGTAGAVNPASGTGWIATKWQSLQGTVQYIAASAVVAANVAFKWYTSMVLYTGPNQLTGYFTFVINLSYNFA